MARIIKDGIDALRTLKAARAQSEALEPFLEWFIAEQTADSHSRIAHCEDQRTLGHIQGRLEILNSLSTYIEGSKQPLGDGANG